MKNFYEILEVDSSADEKEIKRAYVRMLRKFPPEKAPEEFKKIREAYECLSDPISRAEYNAYSQYQDEIEKYDAEAQAAFEAEDFEKAISCYKKILVIEPSLTFAKNRLGNALVAGGYNHEALKQFEELIEINPENALFYSNMAVAYRELGEYAKAEKNWLKAHELDPINDSVILSLVDLYIKTKKYDVAISFLNDCIGKNTENEFQDFIYYFEMISVYILSKNNSGINSVFGKIRQITPNDTETKEYVAWKFGTLAFDLYEAKLYESAEKISREALAFNPDDEALNKLHDASNELKMAHQEFKNIENNSNITNGIKRLIALWLSSDLSDSERNNYFQDIISEIDSEDPEKLSESIKFLKKYFPNLYRLNSDFLDEVNKIAEENLNSRSTQAYSSSNTSSYNTSSSYSDNGGCIWCVICAVIGTFVAPGLGTIIGWFVGKWMEEHL